MGLQRLIQLVAYATPNFSMHILIVPAASILPTLYAKERGVELALIGTILVGARIFDALSDQIIGYFSDRTLLKWRSGRKIWIAAGAVMVLPTIYFLFIPGPDAGAAYFAVWSLILYFAWTMMAIPYTAWGAELSRGYNERTSIVTARAFVGELGGMFFLGAPLIFFALGMVDTTEVTLEVIKYVAFALFLLIPLSIAPALTLVPQGPARGSTPPGLLAAAQSVRHNKPLLIYLSAFLIAEVGYGMFATMLFLYIDNFLGLSAEFPYLIVAAVLSSLAALPIWMFISRRLGKIRTWRLCWVLSGFAFLTLALIPAGGEGFWVALVCICLNTSMNGAGMIVAPSVLGDIVDYERLKSGGHRAGNFFALHALVVKLVAAMGGGIAFFLLDLTGYDLTITGEQSEQARFGIILVMAVLPALFRFTSVGVLHFFPLDAKRQAIIRKRLEQNEARAQRDATSQDAV